MLLRAARLSKRAAAQKRQRIQLDGLGGDYLVKRASLTSLVV